MRVCDGVDVRCEVDAQEFDELPIRWCPMGSPRRAGASNISNIWISLDGESASLMYIGSVDAALERWVPLKQGEGSFLRHRAAAWGG